MRAEFKFHKLNKDGQEVAIKMAQCFDELLTDLEEVCQSGRELSIAKTKLEEACFFAKKAMAINPHYQEKDLPPEPKEEHPVTDAQETPEEADH